MTTDEGWLNDMLASAKEALELTQSFDFERFQADRAMQLAIMHLIVIIGEAAGQVSEEARLTLPALPWREIVAMRNRLVHHYFKARLDLVWDVVTVDLPVLITELESREQPQP